MVLAYWHLKIVTCLCTSLCCFFPLSKVCFVVWHAWWGNGLCCLFMISMVKMAVLPVLLEVIMKGSVCMQYLWARVTELVAEWLLIIYLRSDRGYKGVQWRKYFCLLLTPNYILGEEKSSQKISCIKWKKQGGEFVWFGQVLWSVALLVLVFYLKGQCCRIAFCH